MSGQFAPVPPSERGRPRANSESANAGKGKTHARLRRTRLSSLGALPTASGGIARAAYKRTLDAHIDVEKLLIAAGLPATQIKDSQARIAVRTQIAFLDQVAAALGEDFLGFGLLKTVDLRELGLLYYVLASSEDLDAALTRLTRFSTILNEG